MDVPRRPRSRHQTEGPEAPNPASQNLRCHGRRAWQDAGGRGTRDDHEGDLTDTLTLDDDALRS
ncbi:MAG: hypothetical protein AVDCRST_MAG70-66 [uncultured Thermomicrobiales bacterium]|uniref:Uncharacterized protein n=1 Tax=uncultured Thermomicrobiales bacterium TaxID=1645740 RepID=A0A6J4U478_9BACT|nr:MAG: hypothetical protein AVDCRST_MAG70-66 [uncultured Thermomicrobiales bacterium]